MLSDFTRSLHTTLKLSVREYLDERAAATGKSVSEVIEDLVIADIIATGKSGKLTSVEVEEVRLEGQKQTLGNTINELENPEKYTLQRQRAWMLANKIYPEFHEDWTAIKLQAIEDLESGFEELVLEPGKAVELIPEVAEHVLGDSWLSGVWTYRFSEKGIERSPIPEFAEWFQSLSPSEAGRIDALTELCNYAGSLKQARDEYVTLDLKLKQLYVKHRQELKAATSNLSTEGKA